MVANGASQSSARGTCRWQATGAAPVNVRTCRRSRLAQGGEAARAAFAGFVGGKTFNAAQLHFVDLVVMHLTESGVVPIDRLYALAYTDMPRPGQRTCSVART